MTNIGEDKEDFLMKLTLMFNKNDKVLKLIEALNLKWACPPLNEKMSTNEIIDYLTNLKIKQMSTKAKQQTESKFKNTVPETVGQNAKFFKFESEGEQFEGDLIGFKMIKNTAEPNKPDNKHFIMELEGEQFLMPSNSDLVKKLEFVFNTKLEVNENNPIACCVTFVEQLKHPTKPAQTIKKFKVEY
jgi:hypothetical protein